MSQTKFTNTMYIYVVSYAKWISIQLDFGCVNKFAVYDIVCI